MQEGSGFTEDVLAPVVSSLGFLNGISCMILLLAIISRVFQFIIVQLLYVFIVFIIISQGSLLGFFL